MTRLMDSVHQSLNDLYSDALTPDRFRKWRAKISAATSVLGAYAVGEIRWRKELGRPATASLSEGFHIKATQEIWMQVPSDPGTVDFEKKPMERSASWQDGKEDPEFWRVAFLVGGLAPGHTKESQNDLHTEIVPSLKSGVQWTHPGGRFAVASYGSRVIAPPGAYFVKDNEVVYLHFEVVARPLWTFDVDGIGNRNAY